LVVDRADDAVDFYLSVFPDSRRLKHSVYGPNSPMPEGTTLTVCFELDGPPFMVLNGGPT